MTVKHTVHTDALETLGTIIDETAARDAIHLAVEPCVAGMKLFAGGDVYIRDERAYMCARGDHAAVGIVDPFLSEPVRPDQRFWLVLYPRTITSLRHVWSHPAFPEQKIIDGPSQAASRAYIENWADNNGTSYEMVLEELSKDDGYYNFGTGESGNIPGEIWSHIENVTGRKMTTRGDYFSCSC